MALSLLSAASIWGQPAKKEAGKEDIRIGMSLPLSGLAAPWGIQSLQAGEMMANDINAAGGIEADGKKKKIKVIAYDDKYDGSIGLKNTNRLIYQDKVDVMIYQSGDVPTVCRDLCKKAGVLVWGTAYVKDQPSPAYPYIFAKFLRYPETINSCYKWFAKNRPEIKKIAYMAPKEARTQTCIEVLESTAAGLGLKIVAKELFESGTEDFNAVLLRILKEKPDIIDVTSSFTHESGIIAKQARGLGYKGPIFHACAAELAAVMEIGGAQNAEGFMSGLEVGEPLSPKMKEIEQRYLKKYGGPFPSGFFQYWDGYEVLFEAIRRARSVEAKKVADVMHKGEFDTVWGKARFCGKAFYGINNQMMTNIPIAIVQGGKVKQLTWVDGKCAGE
jgi:branched-chain amino acid transport system substrate-binding protein